MQASFVMAGVRTVGPKEVVHRVLQPQQVGAALSADRWRPERHHQHEPATSMAQGSALSRPVILFPRPCGL
jgi:hypothetical protein